MDDCISRAEAIEAISEECKVCEPSGNCPFIMNCLIKQKRKALSAVPPADVRPVKEGERIKNKDRVGWHCSVCKVDNNYAYSWNSETGKNEFQDNYCPNCGAEMRHDTTNN